MISLAFFGGRPFIILRCRAADMVPRCFRSNEDVHFDVYSGITIYAAKRNPMNRAFPQAAKRGAADTAKCERPPLSSSIVRDQRILTARPVKVATRRQFGICG